MFRLQTETDGVFRNGQLAEDRQASAVGVVGAAAAFGAAERARRAAPVLVLVGKRGVGQRSGAQRFREDGGGAGTLLQRRRGGGRQAAWRAARVWGRQEGRQRPGCWGLERRRWGGFEGGVHLRDSVGEELGEVCAGGGGG